MLLHIPEILSQEQIQKVQEILKNARFVDGRLSAGLAARQVKNNEELAANAAEMNQINNIVMGSLVRHPVYLGAALPLRIAAPFYARYTPGMRYGDHVDDPVMGAGERYRSDISITVFLNEPQDYAGGELTIQTPFGEQCVKLPAGHAVMYPSSSLHRVAEVTQGERLVAVTWVQSMVRDAHRREILYSLHQAREKLLREQPGTEETGHVDTAYVNLIRMWAEL